MEKWNGWRSFMGWKSTENPEIFRWQRRKSLWKTKDWENGHPRGYSIYYTREIYYFPLGCGYRSDVGRKRGGMEDRIIRKYLPFLVSIFRWIRALHSFLSKFGILWFYSFEKENSHGNYLPLNTALTFHGVPCNLNSKTRSNLFICS